MSRGSARAFVALVSLGLALGSAGSARAAEAPAERAASSDPHVPFPPPSPRVTPQPDNSYTFHEVRPYPSFAWLLFQMVPSPELVIGRVKETEGKVETAETKASFGLRWQVTPALWSWGTNRRVSRWRYFVVDPLARHSGSLELSANVEYVFGHVDRAIVRPTVRAYFPIVSRGEYLSVSIGTSGYAYDDKVRSAYEVGAYVLSGIFGLQVAVAPDNGPMTFTSTLRIRYF